MPRKLVFFHTEVRKKAILIIIFATLLWFIIFTSILLAIKTASPKIEIFQTETKNKIDVSGTAKLREKADIVEIILGLENRASTASAAQRENTNLMDRVYKAVFSYVQKEAVETVTYEISPVRDWKSPRKEIVGYSVKHLIKIKASPSIAGNIVDAAVNAGANNIKSIIFKLSDSKKEKLGSQALKIALMNANRKASIITSELGVKIKKPLYVNAEYVSTRPIYKSYEEIREVGSEIGVGEIEVEAFVSVSYEIE